MLGAVRVAGYRAFNAGHDNKNSIYHQACEGRPVSVPGSKLSP